MEQRCVHSWNMQFSFISMMDPYMHIALNFMYVYILCSLMSINVRIVIGPRDMHSVHPN